MKSIILGFGGNQSRDGERTVYNYICYDEIIAENNASSSKNSNCYELIRKWKACERNCDLICGGVVF